MATCYNRFDTWTYASANSVIVPGDMSTTYWPGMKVILKQGTLKCFVIEAVSYTSPNTTITLNGMGVYTLTNDPITAHIDTTDPSPKGFPLVGPLVETGLATSKATPADADAMWLRDNALGAARKLSWANLKAALKTYFDSIYSAVGHTHPNVLPETTATDDVVMGNSSHEWVKKTIAELKTALGLGSAAYTASTDYAKLTGQAGGQTFCGGTGASDVLTLKPTSDVSETGKAEIASGGAVKQSDSTGLTKYSRYRIAWPSGVCDGTYSGYILLANAYTTGNVANSEISGRFTLSRGSVSSLSKEDVFEVVSKSAYNSESLVMNRPGGAGTTFFSKLCKITYNSVVYHAIKLTTSGGEAINGLYFDGYASQAPTLVRSDSGSSEADFGNLGLCTTSAGKVGIGVTSPSVGLELANVATTGEGLAYAWGTHSSRRWKEHVEPIRGAISLVQRLRGVSFDWKAECGGKHDIGLIAEDVGQVIPEIVDYEENGIDAKSVKYDRLVAVLIEAVKEQQKEIDELKGRINGT